MVDNVNPLSKNFRQPAMHVKLPSNGQYWPEDSISLPVTGEVPVYPMTTKDEITLKTPDALMNGSGVVSVLQSCCPTIANGWDCPSIDIDTLIIAIRIASYGSSMTVDSKCPHCDEENSFQINLQSIVDGIKAPNYNEPVAFDNLKIYLKPQKYFDFNKRNMIEFEEQQLLKAIGQATDENADKQAVQFQFDKHLSNMISMSTDALVSSTEKIVMDDGTVVTNPDFIKEFYNNSKGAVTKAVHTRINQIVVDTTIKPFDVICADCQQPYKIEFTFDYANFFV